MMGGWPQATRPTPPPTTPPQVCQHSTCQAYAALFRQTYTVIEGSTEQPQYRAAAGKHVYDTVRRQFWVCRDCRVMLNHAEATRLQVRVSPEGWIWIDSLTIILRGIY